MDVTIRIRAQKSDVDENALCVPALTERWSQKLIFNSCHLKEMSKAKIRWVKEHKYLINVSWSKKMVCAAVSQNPMLHRNFPTFECHWLSGRTAIVGLLIVVLRHGHVGGCNPDHLISRKAVQHWNLSERIESEARSRMCENLVVSGALMGQCKNNAGLYMIIPGPRARRNVLPRPMNFSQYVLDFWLHKCCQFVGCYHPNFRLHHVWTIRNVWPNTVQLHFRPSWPCAEAKAAGHCCQWHRRHPARIHAPPARHLDTNRFPSLSDKNPPAICSLWGSSGGF